MPVVLYTKAFFKYLKCVAFSLGINLLFISVVLALPQGAQVESGFATVTSSNANTLDITASNNTIINFSSFNIAKNETVDITLPSNTSSLLARDTGGNASQIMGSLFSNGTLVLTNPNGINFGPSANVQVNNLIASSLDIASNNFINGNYVFEHTPNAAYGQVSNAGTITAKNLVLQGSSVNNSGVIQATMGTVHLISGDQTTVSFDPQGLIKVAINQQTSGKLAGVANAVTNSGQIQAVRVVMAAQTAADIFENVINQSGEVKATQMVAQNGVIRIIANGNVQVSGNLAAPGGKIEISSTERSVRIDQALAAAAQAINISAGKNVVINAPVTTQGNTTISAKNNIVVNADVITDSGNLSLLADSDLDGVGALLQAPGTLIKTTTFGDILIQSSGTGTIANISSAGNLSLNPGKTPAVFNQQINSMAMVALSLLINKEVTLNAANTIYIIGQNWDNNGTFVPQTSQVVLTGPLDAQVLGSNNFNDLIIDPNLNLANPQIGHYPLAFFDQNGQYIPSSAEDNATDISKNVSFDAGATQTINGAFIVQGGFGKLVNINSTSLSIPWQLDILGDYAISYASIQNTTNINTTGPPIAPLYTQNLLGNSGFDFSNAGPVWIGSQDSLNWSDPYNWNGGFAPGVGDIATLGAIASEAKQSLYSNSNSIIDPAFSGTIAGLNISSAYTGTLIFERALSLAGPGSSVISGKLFSTTSIQITSLGDIVFAGPTVLIAPQTNISSQNNIIINAPISAQGNTTFAANNNIYVNANVTVDSGNLSFLADADLDGHGAFIQAVGTSISTTTWGHITIQGSGQNYLANINSAGDITLKQGGAPVVFNAGSGVPNALIRNNITTQGSFIISPNVTVNANNTQYDIGTNWINLGTFNPQISTVTLTSTNQAEIIGQNTFYNLDVQVPGKVVKFDTIAAVDVLNNLSLIGGYGNLLTLESLNPGQQWSIEAPENTDIEYALIGDSISIRGPPLVPLHSSSLGNNTNWDIDPYWVGAGTDSLWSDGLNWDTGTSPQPTDVVTFDGTAHGVSGAIPNKNSVIDTTFTIVSLTISGYTGIITQNASLTVTGAYSQSSGTVVLSSVDSFGSVALSGGTFTAPPGVMSVSGSWANSGVFNANGGTVIFDGTTVISGSSDTSFNNIVITAASVTCNAPTSTLTAPSGNMNVAGNWANSGVFNANGGTVTFDGTTAISGSSVNSFCNIAIAASSALTAPNANIYVGGNWTNNVGTNGFSAGTGTVIFNGTSTLSGATTFNNLTINAGASVSLTSGQTFTVAGTFTAQAIYGGAGITLNATTNGSQAFLNVTTLGTVSYASATDISSNGGVQIVDANGALSNTLNWQATGTTYYAVSNGNWDDSGGNIWSLTSGGGHKPTIPVQGTSLLSTVGSLLLLTCRVPVLH